MANAKPHRFGWLTSLFTSNRKAFSEETSCQFLTEDGFLVMDLAISGSVSKTNLIYDLIYPYVYSTAGPMLQGRAFKVTCRNISEHEEAVTHFRVSVQLRDDGSEGDWEGDWEVVQGVLTQIQQYAITRLASSAREGFSGFGSSPSLTLADKDMFDEKTLYPDLADQKTY